jgi:hypothetical protein
MNVFNVLNRLIIFTVILKRAYMHHICRNLRQLFYTTGNASLDGLPVTSTKK